MNDELSSNLKETLERIDKVIAEKKQAIRRGQLLKDLMTHEGFKELFLEGYIEAEARKLFQILTDPSGATPYTPEQIHLKLEAISHFKGYVGTDDYKGTIMIEAEQAIYDIEREEQYRKEVTAEAARNQ